MAATQDMEVDAPVSKIVSPLQQGLVHMKDTDVLTTCKTSLITLADTIKADMSLGFDAIHANIPWKAVSVDYLMSLPIRDLLVANGDMSSLFLWVDSPYMAKAVDVLRAWGFEFKSVLHVVAFDRPVVEKASNNTKEETSDEAESPVDAEKSATEAPPTDAQSTASVAPRVPRKQAIPPGWTTEGIVASRTRQLWYCERVSTTGTGEATTSSRFLKDPSFIRKRIAQVSTFLYPDAEDFSVTTLSAKKKNIEYWKIFQEYDSYLPPHLRSVLEQIFKPSARVLSIFADGLSRSWFTWGPNVPGYFCGPLRNDSGFPLPTVLLKSLSNIKLVTVHKYLTLINQYAVNLGKQLGTPASSEESIGPLLEGRMGEFVDELSTKAESGGGVRENALSSVSRIGLMSSEAFRQLDPVTKTQFILMIAYVIRAVFKKNAEAADRRKRIGKRKRVAGDDENPQPAVQRKYGIAAPVRISPELATFMGLEPGAKMARTAVVKFINEYIKKNNLQNPEKKNNILLNDELKGLLQPDENFGPVTYFNLCRLLKSHFVPVGNDALEATTAS